MIPVIANASNNTNDMIRNITMAFKSFNITLAVIASVIHIVIAIAILAISEKIRKQNNDTDTKKKNIITTSLSFVAFVVILMFGMALISTLQLYNTAKAHGYSKTERNYPIEHIWKSIDLSPAETKLDKQTWKQIEESIDSKTNPECLENKIIIYYRFGCPDCEATFHDLYDKTKNNPNIYWFASRSKHGKMLMQKYAVPEVPSGAYINKDRGFAYRQLYKKVGGKSVIDEDNLDQLIAFIKNKE